MASEASSELEDEVFVAPGGCCLHQKHSQSAQRVPFLSAAANEA